MKILLLFYIISLASQSVLGVWEAPEMHLATVFAWLKQTLSHGEVAWIVSL